MIYPRIATLVSLIVGVFAATAHADVGITPRAGTLGAGAEISTSIGSKLSIGFAYNGLDYDFDDSASDIDYDFELELKTYGLLVNFHPFEGIFRLTGGVFRNHNALKISTVFQGGESVGNGTANAGDTLSGKLSFDSTAPYIGIGWGGRPGSRFGISADIGALYQGSPKLSLTGTGSLSAANVEAERRDAEDDLKDFKWYPVLSIGFYLRF